MAGRKKKQKVRLSIFSTQKEHRVPKTQEAIPPTMSMVQRSELLNPTWELYQRYEQEIQRLMALFYDINHVCLYNIDDPEAIWMVKAIAEAAFMEYVP